MLYNKVYCPVDSLQSIGDRDDRFIYTLAIFCYFSHFARQIDCPSGIAWQKVLSYLFAPTWLARLHTVPQVPLLATLMATGHCCHFKSHRAGCLYDTRIGDNQLVDRSDKQVGRFAQ